jgi:hypothetical protein
MRPGAQKILLNDASTLFKKLSSEAAVRVKILKLFNTLIVGEYC